MHKYSSKFFVTDKIKIQKMSNPKTLFGWRPKNYAIDYNKDDESVTAVEYCSVWNLNGSCSWSTVHDLSNFYSIKSINLPNLFFRNKDDPAHRTTPSAMIAIRSPNKSASSMKCVDRTIVLDSRSLCSRFQICLLASGSMPEVGSSKMMIFKKNHC